MPSILETQEANVPVRRTDFQLLRDLIVAQELFILPPALIEANGLAMDAKRFYAIRIMQNCGTVAVYWKFGSAPSVNSFHGIMKAGAAVDDGNGGVVDLSRARGEVYILAATGNPRIAVLQALAPEGASQASKP